MAQASNNEARVLDFTRNNIPGSILVQKSGKNTYYVETFMFGGVLTNGGRTPQEIRIGKPPAINIGEISQTWRDIRNKIDSNKLAQVNQVNPRVFQILETHIITVCDDFRKTIRDYMLNNKETPDSIKRVYNNVVSLLRELNNNGIRSSVSIPPNGIDTIINNRGNNRIEGWFNTQIDNIKTQILPQLQQLANKWKTNYDSANKMFGKLYKEAAAFYKTQKSSKDQLQQYIKDNPNNPLVKEFVQYGNQATKIGNIFTNLAQKLNLITSDKVNDKTGLVRLRVDK